MPKDSITELSNSLILTPGILLQQVERLKRSSIELESIPHEESTADRGPLDRLATRTHMQTCWTFVAMGYGILLDPISFNKDHISEGLVKGL